MSILNEEEFKMLRQYKGKIDITILEKILDEIEEDFEKSHNLSSSIIFVYANYLTLVKQNREFFDLLSKILQKYSPKMGTENVIQLVIHLLR